MRSAGSKSEGASQSRRWFRVAVIIISSVAGLALTSVPAQASNNWVPDGKSCDQFGPSDPGSCDAWVSLTEVCFPGCSYLAVTGRFEAYGENVQVYNQTSLRAKWHLYIPDQADPSGYLAAGQCIEWARSYRTDRCTRLSGYDIAEGRTPIYLEVCVYDYDHWHCTKRWGTA